MRWSQHHATSYQCSTAKMKEQVFLMENISTAQVSSFAHMQSFYFQSFLWAVEEVMWLPNVTPWERRMWVTAADCTRVKWRIWFIKSKDNKNLHDIGAWWCLGHSECDLAAQAWVSSGTGNVLHDMSRCLQISAWDWHWALVEEYLIAELSFCAAPE